MHDVIIVGAGLAGSGAAAHLASRGWDVLLLERDHFPRHKVCGEFLSPESQHSLQVLGLFDAVKAAQPIDLKGAEISVANGSHLEVDLPGIAWGLSRYALDQALAQAAVVKGADLWQGAVVQNVQPSNRYVQVQGRREGQRFQVEARLAIIASGRSGSANLPPETLVQARNSWRNCVGVKAHYTNVDMPNRVELALYPRGYIGINPVEGGRANVCLLVQADSFQRSAMAELTSAVQQTRLSERLTAASICIDSMCTVANVDTQRKPEPIWRDMACIGDVAAMIPPLCGDGMAMALHSAQLLTPLADRHLSGELSQADYLSQYREVWHQAFRVRLRVGQNLQKLLSIPLVGNGLLHVGRQVPALADYFGRVTRGPVTTS